MQVIQDITVLKGHCQGQKSNPSIKESNILLNYTGLRVDLKKKKKKCQSRFRLFPILDHELVETSCLGQIGLNDFPQC